jgi:hypothetical protein
VHPNKAGAAESALGLHAAESALGLQRGMGRAAVVGKGVFFFLASVYCPP